MQRFLLNNEIMKLALEEEIKHYFTLNMDCGVAADTVWDAFKVVIRGQMILLSSASKREKDKAVSDIKSKIKKLEANLFRYGGQKTC